MSQKSSFDYTYTSSTIDKAIDMCKNTIENYLIDYIGDLSPYIPQAEIERIAKNWGKKLYDAISDSFEIVRGTNVEIRDETNKQISELENEIRTLKDNIKFLESQL